MFNSLGSTPSYRMTTRQPPHHSHRCPLFQIQRQAPTSPTPTLAAVKPPRVELPPVTPSAKTQVQRITRLYPPSSKEETRLNLNYPTYPTPTSTAPSCPSDSQNPTPFEPKLPLKLYTHPTPSKGRIRQNHSPKTLFQTRQVYSIMNFTRSSFCARFSYCTRS